MKKLLGAFVMISLALFVHNSCGGGGGGGGADTQAPTNVTITSGITPGQVVSGIVRLTATAQDNSGSIQKIEFYVSTDPVLACTAQGPKPSGQSFSCDWNSTTVANGPHTLMARAYDPAGNTADSQGINFTVNNWNLADLYSTPYSSVKYTNLVKAPNGRVYLAFYDGAQGPMVASSSDSNPSNLGEPSPIEIPENRNGDYGLDLSFAVSADNEPSAGYGYRSPATSRLPVYASYLQGEWVHHRGLGPFSDAGYHTSLARSRIQGEGDDLLVYAVSVDHQYIATLTHCTPNACDLPKNLGEPGLAYSVLPLGGNADPVLLFYLTPGTNSSLRMIVCSRMNCPGSPSPVTIGTGLGTVDLNTPPVRSVIIGQTAWVVVAGSSPSSFKCVASSAIPTECSDPTKWTREQISADTATWLSLAVNSSTNLPIVAYTTSSGELKYAVYNVGWGTPETVVSGLATGSGYPAITHYTVNSTGFVAIVFFDAGTGRIRIATRSG